MDHLETVPPPASGVSPVSSIQELALRARAGNQRALDQLHKQLSASLAAYFRKRAGVKDGDAEELSHQALTEAFQALSQGRYDENRAGFLTFAYSVAHKVKLQHIYRQRRAVAVSALDPGDGDEPGSGTAGIVDDRSLPPLDEIEAMRACLCAEGSPHSLSAEERFVIVGRVDRKTFEVLAKQLGRSRDTVHRHSVRGLEKLRKCMESKGYC